MIPHMLERFLSYTGMDGSGKFLRIDGGANFKGLFDEIDYQERLRRERVPPNSPQFNDCAERRIINMLEATTFAARL